MSTRQYWFGCPESPGSLHPIPHLLYWGWSMLSKSLQASEVSTFAQMLGRGTRVDRVKKKVFLTWKHSICLIDNRWVRDARGQLT